MIAHCEAREGPDRDPRPAARPAAAGDARVADERRRLRLQVRHALLPVAGGHGPDHPAADDGAAVRPHGRRLGPHRQHPRRPQGARQRGRAGRQRPRLPDHPRGAGRAQPQRASTASARSPAAASASGAPARSRAIPSGGTSTSAACSTTSPSRSWRGRSGPCSSPTTSGSGCGCGSRPRASSPAPGARARCSARRPTEAFFVKCDAETNPPDVIEAGQVVIEIGIWPVKPAEFVIFRISQFTAGATRSDSSPSDAASKGGQQMPSKQPRPVIFPADLGGNEGVGVFRECSGLDSETEVIEQKSVDDNGRPTSARWPAGSSGRTSRSSAASTRAWTSGSGGRPWSRRARTTLASTARSSCSTTPARRSPPGSSSRGGRSSTSARRSNASGNKVAVEEIHICHEGLERM